MSRVYFSFAFRNAKTTTARAEMRRGAKCIEEERRAEKRSKEQRKGAKSREEKRGEDNICEASGLNNAF